MRRGMLGTKEVHWVRLYGKRRAVLEGRTSMVSSARLKSVQKTDFPNVVSLCTAIKTGTAGTFPREGKRCH